MSIPAAAPSPASPASPRPAARRAPRLHEAPPPAPDPATPEAGDPPPGTGDRPSVSYKFWLSRDLLARVSDYADRYHDGHVSAAVRHLLALGLHHAERATSSEAVRGCGA